MESETVLPLTSNFMARSNGSIMLTSRLAPHTPHNEHTTRTHTTHNRLRRIFPETRISNYTTQPITQNIPRNQNIELHNTADYVEYSPKPEYRVTQHSRLRRKFPET